MAAAAFLVRSLAVVHVPRMLSGITTYPAGTAVSDCVVQLESSDGVILQETVSMPVEGSTLRLSARGQYFLEITSNYGFVAVRLPLQIASGPSHQWPST